MAFFKKKKTNWSSGEYESKKTQLDREIELAKRKKTLASYAKKTGNQGNKGLDKVKGFLGQVSKNMESSSKRGYSPFGPSAYGATGGMNNPYSKPKTKRKKTKKRRKVYYEYR